MPVQTSHDNPAAASQRAAVARWFGRFQLLRLLGKSERTMAWRVSDSRSQQELMLVLPRTQPADAAALEAWQLSQRQAARLAHPQLAAVVDSGAHDGWPFVAYDPRDHATLSERLAAPGLPGIEAATLTGQALQGLAFAHEAGVAHHDVQPYMVLVGDNGEVRVAGLGVAADAAPAVAAARHLGSTEPGALRAQRGAAESDVLACGLLLHALLSGQPALDEPDIGRVIRRMAPPGAAAGRDTVRLPWNAVHPIPEPLRAIVDRATDRQERQRYRSARTFIRALDGWRQTESSGGGPLSLLADRLRSAGVLPSSPGTAARAARLALMERERTNELAEVVLEDLALTFELLRLVNAADLRGSQRSTSGVVLTVRRAIAMLGLDGVRRAALGLRAWPGPLGEGGAAELQALIDRCKRAARVALALRPGAGFDAEVVSLITLLQNLGRLVVQYHFADEALQIRRLMQPAPPARAGEPEEPGMTEEAASFAVLGADTEAIGAAVARHWGLDDSVLAMVRRQPLDTPVRGGDGDDDELLRMLASCANEAVDAITLPAPRVIPALQRVLQRYGRALDITGRDLQAALQGKSEGSAGVADAAAPSVPVKTAPAQTERRLAG